MTSNAKTNKNKSNQSTRNSSSSSNIPFSFHHLCQFFEELCNKKIRVDKEQKIGKLFDYVKRYQLDFYSILRLLCCDKDSRVYSYKEFRLALKYSNALGISKTSYGDMLKNWKQTPSQSNDQGQGDFASVVYSVISSQNPGKENSNWSIQQLNEWLDSLAEKNILTLLEPEESEKTPVTESKKTTKQVTKQKEEEAFNKMTRECSALEIKWITRILIKQLKIGITSDSIIKLVHPQALSQFNISHDLKEIAGLSNNPSFVVENKLVLNSPFSPMLALFSKTYDDFDEILKNMGGKAIMQLKLDGERCLLHKSGSNYKWFTRNAMDYTSFYGSDPNSGSLAPFIHDLFDSSVENCILDGEMIVFNVLTQSREPFGQLKRAILDVMDKGNNSVLRPYYVAFDCVYLNSESIIHVPLSERIIKLEKIFRSKENALELLPNVEAFSPDDIQKFFTQALDSYQEGIIIKDPRSSYLLGQRMNSWIKMKPELFDQMSETLDVLIVGGSYGSGRNVGKISAFVVAVLDDSKPDYKTNPTYLTISRVGNGFTDIMLDQLENELRDHWQPWNQKQSPDWLPDVPIGTKMDAILDDPIHCKVIEVTVSEINPSASYSSGHGLRFPRLKQMRPDKTHLDVLKKSEIQEIMKSNNGRINHNPNSFSKSKKNKKRRITTGNTKVQIPEHFKSLPKSNQETSIFNKQTISILEKPVYTTRKGEKYTFSQIERLVYENNLGGKWERIPNKATLVIAEKTKPSTIQVLNMIKQGKRDIVTPDWVIDSVEFGKMKRFTDKYTIHLRPETEIENDKYVCKYGYAYDEYVDTDELLEICEKISVPSPIQCYNSFINMLSWPEFNSFKTSRIELFSGVIAWIPQQVLPFEHFSLKIFALQLKMNGAFVIRSDLDDEAKDNITHVFVDPSIEICDVVKRKVRDMGLVFLNISWIEQCLEQKKLLETDEFLVALND